MTPDVRDANGRRIPPPPPRISFSNANDGVLPKGVTGASEEETSAAHKANSRSKPPVYVPDSPQWGVSKHAPGGIAFR